jgi:TPR repeat protein
MQKAENRQAFVHVTKSRAMLFMAAFLLFAQAAHAADIQKGIAAYKDHDYAAALEEFQPLAQQGDVQGEFYLGLMYDRGYGVTRDDDQAIFWYRRASEQGSLIAQYNLGTKYASGNGVSQDYAEAAKWFGMCAERGLAYGQFSLGELYMKGSGVKQDVVAAYALFELSVPKLAADPRVAAGSAKERDDLISGMTQDQIADGRTLMVKMQSGGVMEALRAESIAP